MSALVISRWMTNIGSNMLVRIVSNARVIHMWKDVVKNYQSLSFYINLKIPQEFARFENIDKHFNIFIIYQFMSFNSSKIKKLSGRNSTRAV